MRATLAACGGGDGGGTSTTSGQTSFTSGAISGFGSVIINGIRFDDSAATVSNDDDSTQSKDNLKLRTMAEIEGSSVSTDVSGARHGEASKIRFGSEIVGPVSSVGTANLIVLGQTVNVTATTVFDRTLTNELTSVQVNGVRVEVKGIPSADGTSLDATKVKFEI